MRLTTAGDRLVPLREIQQRPESGTETEEEVQYIPYRPYTPTTSMASTGNILHQADGSRGSSKQTPAEVQVIDITEETSDRPSPFRRPAPRRRQRLHEIVLEDIARREKANDTPPPPTRRKTYDIEEEIRADEIKSFLTPFKYGFHREIRTGPREEHTKTYYITPDGTRVGSRRALNPYLEEFRDIGQDNFNFSPVALQIKDPLQKYQSTQPFPTPHRPAIQCPQWLCEVNFKDNTRYDGALRRGGTHRQPTQQGETKPRRLMDIKLDITNLPRGYRWQLDQEKQRQFKNITINATPKFDRSDDKEQKMPINYPQRDDQQQSKYAASNKQPMRGSHNVINYKDKPPDEQNRHEWP